MRWYVFMLRDNSQTEKIKARTARQAFKVAFEKYGQEVTNLYQTSSLNPKRISGLEGTMNSCWKNWRETNTRKDEVQR